MENLLVTVVTPEGVFLEAKAHLLELPTEDGEIGIYAGHTPLVAAIGAGEMRLHGENGVEFYALAGGFMQVTAHRVRLLASFAGGDEKEDEAEAVERARAALEGMETLSEEQVTAELAALQTQLRHLAETRGRRRGA